MPNHANPKEVIISETLEYFPSDNANVMGDLYGNIINQYQVQVVFENPTGRPPGGLPIRLTGQRRNVEACIRDVWVNPSIEVGTYEASDRDLLVMSYMGDKVAEHRLETGCRVGLPGNPSSASTNFLKDNPDDLHWERHWADAKEKGASALHDDELSDFAIELLANAGVAPANDAEGEYDSCVTAQSYLQLAFAHSPSLQVYLEGLIEENAAKSNPSMQSIAKHANLMFMKSAQENDLIAAGKWLRIYDAADRATSYSMIL